MGLTYQDVGQSLRNYAGGTTFANGPLGLDARTPAGGTTTYYLRDPSGVLLGMSSGGTNYYYLYDGIGSVAAVVNASGSSVVDRYSYSPYGRTLSATGSVFNPIRFAGGYLDTYTGLYHFGARYYDPNTATWTQPDPLGGSLSNPLTMNPYVYAGDNPVNYVDPSGTSLSAAFHYGTQWSGYGFVGGAVVGCGVGGTAGGIIGIGGGPAGVVLGAIAGCTFGGAALAGPASVLGAVAGFAYGLFQ